MWRESQWVLSGVALHVDGLSLLGVNIETLVTQRRCRPDPLVSLPVTVRAQLSSGLTDTETCNYLYSTAGAFQQPPPARPEGILIS